MASSSAARSATARRRAARSASAGSFGAPSIVGNSSEPISASSCLNAGKARASATEKRAISRLVSSSRLCSTKDEPSGKRFSDGPAGLTSIPRSASRRSRHTAGRIALSTYAPGEARNPGWNSSVTHAPPTISRRSSTSVRSPAEAR